MQTKQDMFRDIETLVREKGFHLFEAVDYVAGKNDINKFQLGLWYNNYVENFPNKI
jgi:hypothetical protein